MRLKRFLGLAIAAALLGLIAATPAAGADSAVDYPNRPIRMLVPNAPGSSVDTLGRIFAQALTNVTGQQVVIDNRAGAGGVLGMEIGKNANPDGYTKSKNGEVNMASAGPGSQSHLAGVLLTSLGKFQSLHVPYKGGGPSVASVVAGKTQWTITPAPAVAGLIRSGKLRAVAHSLPKRDPLLADLPSVAETVPGYEYSGWNGLLAPKGTPKSVLDKLRDALIRATQTPELKKAFEQQLTQVYTNTPAEFRAFVGKEFKEMGPVIKAAGLKVE